MSWYNPASWNWSGGQAGKDIDTSMPHGKFGADFAQGQLAGVGNRTAPQFASQEAAQARLQQAQLAQMLHAQASGQTAGAGELAVNRQVGQANAAQQAQAMMARGQNSALAQRGAARNTADIGVNGAGQAAIAQMGDQQNAQQQLAGLLGNMRGQDIGIGQGNQQAQLSQTGMNDSATGMYLGNLLGFDQAQLQAMFARQGLMSADKGLTGPLLAAGGQIGAAAAQNPGNSAAASDRTLKKEIKSAQKDADDLMSKLKPYTYKYKDEVHGVGSRLGIMAQDLEKSRLGKATVVQLPSHPDKKGFDLNKGISASLAGIARLHERLAAVEARAEKK